MPAPKRRRQDDDALDITIVLTPAQARSLAEQLAHVTTRSPKKTRLRLRVKASTAPSSASGVQRDEGLQPLDSRRLIDDLGRMGAEVPPLEWSHLPTDLTDQLDHYLYGTPRR